MLRYLSQQLHTFSFNSTNGGNEKSKTESAHESQMADLVTEQQMCINEQMSFNEKNQNQLNVRAAETNSQVVLSTSKNNDSQVVTMLETAYPQMTMSAIDIEGTVRMEHPGEARLSELENGCRRQRCRNPEGFEKPNKTDMKCGQLLEDVPANIPCHLPQTHENNGLILEQPKWLGSNSLQKVGLQSGGFSEFESLWASILRSGISETGTTPDRALVSSNVNPNNLVPRYKDAKVVLPSTCTDVILLPKFVQLSPAALIPDFDLSSPGLLPKHSSRNEPKFVTSTSPPILGSGLTFLGLGLSSSLPKAKQSRVCTSIVLRSKFVPLTSPPILGLGSTSDIPKIDLTQACTDIVLRSRCICTAPILRPKASTSPIVHQPRSFFADSLAIVLVLGVILALEIGMQLVCWDVILSRIIFSFLARLNFGSVPARTPKRIKLISTSKCPDIVIPAKTSPPIILASSESVLNRLDPRIQVNQAREAIQAKAAIQAKIRGQSKARAKNAAKALKNAWNRNPKHIKARKQAEKAAQLASDKIEELRLKEEKIWTDFEKTYA
ncbi:hypothetical protein MMC07_001340 [Pseudocyphellaria aurata]|nr:hypothetical protein [Pseudocyphellaria aurata]